MSWRPRLPRTPVVETWRPSSWYSVPLAVPAISAAVGLLVIDLRSAWPIAIALLFVAGCTFGPRVTLYEDALVVQGVLRRSVIPIEEIAELTSSQWGATVDWGDERFTSLGFIGSTGWFGIVRASEQQAFDGLTAQVLSTRDRYLAKHRLVAPIRNRARRDEAQREFEDRGWSEVPVPHTDRRVYRQP